jgi:hypothetical protein
MKRKNKSLTQLAASALSFLISIMMIIQIITVDSTAYGASPYYFRGYDTENITSSTFTFSDSHTYWNEGNIESDDPPQAKPSASFRLTKRITIFRLQSISEAWKSISLR